MGLTLNRPSEGFVAWFSNVDSNWSKLQDEFGARRKSDGAPVTVNATTAETALMANCTITGTLSPRPSCSGTTLRGVPSL